MTLTQIVKSLEATGKEQEALFLAAQSARNVKYGPAAFIRGVIEISNICTNNCAYCGMRHDNRFLSHYTMEPSEIIDVATAARDSGINILFLQAGESAFTTPTVCEVTKHAKTRLHMDVVLCLGNKSRTELQQLKSAGADAYIIKHETCDADLHLKLRGQSLRQRIECARTVHACGLYLGGGNIVGLPGQSLESIAEDISVAQQLHVDYVSASPFIAHEASPLNTSPPPPADIVLNTMALMRILINVPMPTVSVLDTLVDDGQLKGFNAGANVLTVNLTPEKYRRQYSLYSQRRPNKNLAQIKAMICEAGLNQATTGYIPYYSPTL